MPSHYEFLLLISSLGDSITSQVVVLTDAEADTVAHIMDIRGIRFDFIKLREV